MLAGMMIVIAALGTIQNCTFLFLVISQRITASLTHKVLALLSLCDLFTSLFVAPLHIVQALMPSQTTNCTTDMLRTQLSAIFISLSCYLVSLLSLERFFAVRFPMDPHVSPVKLSISIIAIVVWAVLIPALRLIPGTLGFQIYSAAVVVNGVAIIITLVASYLNLLFILRLTKDKVPPFTRSRSSIRERKITKVVVIILTTFVLMITPMIFYHLIQYLAPESRTLSSKIYVFAITISCLNCLANPLLYYLTSPAIRKSVLALLSVQPLDAAHPIDLPGPGPSYRPESLPMFQMDKPALNFLNNQESVRDYEDMSAFTFAENDVSTMRRASHHS